MKKIVLIIVAIALIAFATGCESQTGKAIAAEKTPREKVVVISGRAVGTTLTYKVKVLSHGVVGYVNSNYAYAEGDTMYVPQGIIKF